LYSQPGAILQPGIAWASSSELTFTTWRSGRSSIASFLASCLAGQLSLGIGKLGRVDENGRVLPDEHEAEQPQRSKPRGKPLDLDPVMSVA